MSCCRKRRTTFLFWTVGTKVLKGYCLLIGFSRLGLMLALTTHSKYQEQEKETGRNGGEKETNREKEKLI